MTNTSYLVFVKSICLLSQYISALSSGNISANFFDCCTSVNDLIAAIITLFLIIR